MRAANLMPGADGASRADNAAGAGGGVYVLLAALAALVALAAVWATMNKQVGDGRARLDRVNAEAQLAEARIARAQPYQTFAALARDRVATVTSLSATRFDWAHGLREISRVLPDDVWLTALTGTSGAGGEAPSPTTRAAPAPIFELLGCTGDQAKVARLLARLRAVDGVRDVALRTSSKPDGPGSGDCPAGAAGNPRFSIAIAFAVPGSPKGAVDATGTAVDTSVGDSASPPDAAAATPTPAPKPAPSAVSDASIR